MSLTSIDASVVTVGGTSGLNVTICDATGNILTATLSRLEIGITPGVDSRPVSIDVPDVPRLLEWIGDPLPDAEHKWPTSKIEYDHLRDQQ